MLMVAIKANQQNSLYIDNNNYNNICCVVLDHMKRMKELEESRYRSLMTDRSIKTVYRLIIAKSSFLSVK